MPATPRPGSRPAHAPGTTRFHLVRLEDRLTPALAFQFDYSLDASGFFNNPAARSMLEAAGADVAAQIASTPAAITPGGNLSWTAVFDNPSAPGQQVRKDNLAIPGGTLLVFAGALPMNGATGLGGPGGYTVSGTRAWQQTVTTRGLPGFSTWGGSVSFDTNQNYYFGADPNGMQPGQLDFYSLASHELVHVLGFGTSPQWRSLVRNGRFVGPAAVAANGGVAPSLSPDGEHLAQGTKSTGCDCALCTPSAVRGNDPVSMAPVMTPNRRVGISELDKAILQDLGWQVTANGGVSLPAPAATPQAPPSALANPAASVTPVPAGVAVTVVSGSEDGTAQAYTTTSTGQLTPVGPLLRPFPGFGGVIRATAADVNGDGTHDLVLGTGPGGGSQIRILDGKTFTDLAAPFTAFEGSFAGGVFLAAGDFDADGRADIVVTPDQGGGGRVRVLALSNGVLVATADFFGIDDPSFRGGARTAVGDVNGDGTPDLVVSAGFGGGPRVALFDGQSVLAAGGKRKLVGDFFAFEESLRNGAYVSVGDVNADGFGDVVLGAGPGGGPRVLTLSGRTLVSNGGPTALSQPLGDTFAGDPSDRGGVRVAAKELAGAAADVVVTGSGTKPEVRVYRTTPTGLTPTATLTPFGGPSADGVYVG